MRRNGLSALTHPLVLASVSAANTCPYLPHNQLHVDACSVRGTLHWMHQKLLYFPTAAQLERTSDRSQGPGTHRERAHYREPCANLKPIGTQFYCKTYSRGL